jgi:hypothetical protein
MSKRNGARKGIRVGSRVVYQMPWGPMNAIVVEDRGNLGWQGRHLMSIRPLFDGVDNADPWEVPLDELRLAD